MKNTKIQIRLPQDLRDAAVQQAGLAGVSLNLFVATAVAARAGAQAEAARYFAARSSRTTPARAKAILMRLGSVEPPRDDDRFETQDQAEP